MTHKIPSANWATALAGILGSASPGDVVEVNTEAKADLARRAMQRMGITGIKIVLVAAPCHEPTGEN